MAVMAERIWVSSLASTSAFSAKTRRTARRRGTTHSGSKLAFNSNVVVTTPPSWGRRSGRRSGCGPGMRLHTGSRLAREDSDPRSSGSEPDVLPLHHSPSIGTELVGQRGLEPKASWTPSRHLPEAGTDRARCQAAPLPDGLDGEI